MNETNLQLIVVYYKKITGTCEIQQYYVFYSISHHIPFIILEKHQCLRNEILYLHTSMRLRASSFSKVLLARRQRHNSDSLREHFSYLVLGYGGQHHAIIPHLQKIKWLHSRDIALINVFNRTVGPQRVNTSLHYTQIRKLEDPIPNFFDLLSPYSSLKRLLGATALLSNNYLG